MKTKQISSAFKKRLYCGQIKNVRNIIDPMKFLDMCKVLLLVKIGDFFFNYRSAAKANVELACEYIAQFRGAAHQACNLNYKLPTFVPVFFHNISGYDSHLFVKELGADEEEIQLLQSNEERYISFSKKVGNMKLRFLDSFRFMGSSLEKLESYMGPTALTLLRKHFPDLEKFNLLTRKGVFPYDYVNDWTRLDEKVLPSKESFYTKLTGMSISDKDYAHAQRVWDTFKISDMGDYLETVLADGRGSVFTFLIFASC